MDELSLSSNEASNSLLWQYCDSLARLAEVWAELPDGSEVESDLRDAIRAVASRVTHTATIYTFTVKDEKE